MRKSTITIRSSSPEATRLLGAALAKAILQTSSEQALVIALSGELGAGKTTLVSGLLKFLGVSGSVRSPTYTLIEPYELASRQLYHLDLYRLAAASELEMLAPRDLLEPGAVLLVEWPERAGNALPTPDLAIQLRYPVESGVGLHANRLIEITTGSISGQMLAASLQAHFDLSIVSS